MVYDFSRPTGPNNNATRLAEPTARPGAAGRMPQLKTQATTANPWWLGAPIARPGQAPQLPSLSPNPQQVASLPSPSRVLPSQQYRDSAAYKAQQDAYARLAASKGGTQHNGQPTKLAGGGTPQGWVRDPNTGRLVRPGGNTPSFSNYSGGGPAAGLSIGNRFGTGLEGMQLSHPGGGAGQGGGGNLGLDQANQRAQADQQLIKDLLLGSGSPAISGRFTGSAEGQVNSGQATAPEGFGADMMRQSRANIVDQTAASSAANNTDMKNALAASGFGDSPAAMAALAQQRTQAALGQGQRLDDLSRADESQRQSNQNAALDRFVQLSSAEESAMGQAANQVGQFEYPWLTPEAQAYMGQGGGAGGSGAGGAGGGYAPGASGPAGFEYTGGAGGVPVMMPNARLPMDANTGLLYGASRLGNIGSPGQLKTLQGNHRYRAQTGQDVSRDYAGRQFGCFSF